MKYATTAKIAESLSLALNPFLLLPVIFLIALFLTDFPSAVSQGRWLGVILGANLLLPLWLVFYLDQQGVVLDDTLANKDLHRQRLTALLPILFIITLEVLVMIVTHIYEPLFAVFLSSFLIAGIGGMISYYWKISAHSMGLTTSITLLTLLVGPWALLGALAIPILAWARLALHRHTPYQLIAGLFLPPIIILCTFAALHLF